MFVASRYGVRRVAWASCGGVPAADAVPASDPANVATRAAAVTTTASFLALSIVTPFLSVVSNVGLKN